MAQTYHPNILLDFAAEILTECYRLQKHIQKNSIPEPSLAVGASTELWSSSATQISEPKTRILGLIEQLQLLIQGPHEYLHDYVSSNWEYGALYTVLQFEVLEKIPLEGQAHVSALAKQSGLPENKLLRFLRLLCCRRILIEIEEKSFCHTAISEELIADEKLRAFLGFQLFETRIANAHLADSLSRNSNDFGVGHSAFKHAWGHELYDWHEAHPEKGKRFSLAMQSVSQTLDPANELFLNWFASNKPFDRNLIVEIGGRYGFASTSLAESFPNLLYEIRHSTSVAVNHTTPKWPERIKFTCQTDIFAQQPLEDVNAVSVYIVRNIFWNWSDEDVVKLLQTFVHTLRKSKAVILICDGISPGKGQFEPHVELAYRRRDLTMMTMHNVKQRTEEEWKALFVEASPNFKILTKTATTSHVFKGLWELTWDSSEALNGIVKPESHGM